MRPGENGEVILEKRIEGWYVKTGARLLGNWALASHVKQTPFNDKGEKVLDAQYTDEVKDALWRVADMGHFTSLPFMVYPFVAEFHLQELEGFEE